MLDDISLFVKICRYNSFNDAAHQLGMPLSTISRRVNQLEKNLGSSLFFRDKNGLKLTVAGNEILTACQPSIEHVEGILNTLDTKKNWDKGSIKFVGPTNFISKLFADQFFDDFFEEYPDIVVNFDLSNERSNLNQQQFDLAMRLGDLEDSGFICKTIGKMEFVLVASPQLISTHGSPKNLNGLDIFPKIIFSPIQNWQFTSAENCSLDYLPQGDFISNNIDLCVNRTIAGHGICYLAKQYVADAIATGELLTLLPQYRPRRRLINLLWPSKPLPYRTRVLIDYLANKLAKTI
ncbi:LysR family transcriptional regulator [Shewanella sp. VB17]|uniref:LysR family transcriptional regulator n=1 Tax=Shewanella sp. VB17 TaxID=2739432 RepID=UPI0015670BF1|nr:LysR family transcriptional regulator [Shewanella sp. VB17]NRD72650.1 LysR family transcriptional regulator [Shewanella sp. VB17]